MKKLRSIRGIRDPYTRRILSHTVDKDPLTILAATPRTLKTLLRGLSRKHLLRRPAKRKWSITELMTHLSDTEIVLAFRLRMALAESGSDLQAMDEKKWAARLKYPGNDIRKKLDLFSALRRDHVRTLRSLKRSEWKRYGMHQERGKETIERMAQMYAGHDLNHIAQIRRIKNSFLQK